MVRSQKTLNDDSDDDFASIEPNEPLPEHDAIAAATAFRQDNELGSLDALQLQMQAGSAPWATLSECGVESYVLG